MAVMGTWSVADGFTALMARHTQTESERETRELAALFGELLEKMIEQERVTAFLKPKKNSGTATIKFKAQEIAQMGAEFQKEIKATGNIARVIKTHDNGEITYEIRYCRNGYDLRVFSPDLTVAKQKFIQKTKLENIKIGA